MFTQMVHFINGVNTYELMTEPIEVATSLEDDSCTVDLCSLALWVWPAVTCHFPTTCIPPLVALGAFLSEVCCGMDGYPIRGCWSLAWTLL